MPEPAMIDLLKVLQYLRKRRAEFGEASKLVVAKDEQYYVGRVDGYDEAIVKLEQVLAGHQRTTEKFAMNLQQVLDNER